VAELDVAIGGQPRIREDFPRSIRELENVWIPLSDGTRLAARIWLPDDAEDDPVPAVLEYIPYRKSDGTAVRDSVRHPYTAGFGYAAVRVDQRGSGDSDGLLLDEYLLEEQDDALEVIDWLAAQPWCSGPVGIVGKSWGGFNGLQIAARRPPALKAIVSVFSTDDRYCDDVHYMGGCVVGSDMLSWASVMLSLNALPPDPAIVGERWRELWLERLEHTPPFVEAWLSHQRRDDYWRHGSVCEDYGAIECPVYAIGGFADGYSNPVFRLLERLSCPTKGLIGPWGHQYPEHAYPGPSIGYLQEAIRWWDHWLKGIDTGIMDEPALRVWMQNWIEPRSSYEGRPGRWVAEAAWPSGRVEEVARTLGEGTREVASPQTAGFDAGGWCGNGTLTPGDLPPDQRAEDGLAVTFDSEPLAEPLELLGFPEVELELASDRPCALVAVRLCAVAPGGASLLVTRGLLNLTHRDGHESPEPLEPGRRYRVRVRLNGIAHAVPAGHRLRVAVSSAYWPQAWPSPEPVTLTVFADESRLVLPRRPPRAGDDDLRPFEEPEWSAPLPVEVAGGGTSRWEQKRDLTSGRLELLIVNDNGRQHFPGGLAMGSHSSDHFSIVPDDPLSASARSESVTTLARGDWSVRVETRSHMTADGEAFRVANGIDAYEGEARVYTRSWDFSVPRDLV